MKFINIIQELSLATQTIKNNTYISFKTTKASLNYNNSKNYVTKDNFQMVNQLSNVIENKVSNLPANTSLKIKAADTLLSHKYMNEVDEDERKYYEDYEFYNKVEKKKE